MARHIERYTALYLYIMLMLRFITVKKKKKKESHTLALSTRANDGAIDGQVCFHRRSFDDTVKPRRSTTGSMGPLMGANKAAWGVKLLLMTVSA